MIFCVIEFCGMKAGTDDFFKVERVYLIIDRGMKKV